MCPHIVLSMTKDPVCAKTDENMTRSEWDMFEDQLLSSTSCELLLGTISPHCGLVGKRLLVCCTKYCAHTLDCMESTAMAI